MLTLWSYSPSQSVYQVVEARSIPWFRPSDGAPYICRHELNQRKVGSTIKKYALSICKKGIIQGVRGEPWVVYNNDKDQYECISYGTLSFGSQYSVIVSVSMSLYSEDSTLLFYSLLTIISQYYNIYNSTDFTLIHLLHRDRLY